MPRRGARNRRESRPLGYHDCPAARNVWKARPDAAPGGSRRRAASAGKRSRGGPRGEAAIEVVFWTGRRHNPTGRPVAAEEVADFLAFDPAFRGGVRVALGDINGDGIDDLVVGAGPGGGPLVRVFRGICTGTYTPPTVPGAPASCPSGGFTVDTSAPISEFFAFPSGFRGGVFVAVAHFDKSNDAGNCFRNEIVVGADGGGGPEVRIFRNATVGGGCAVGTPVVIDPNAPIVEGARPSGR